MQGQRNSFRGPHLPLPKSSNSIRHSPERPVFCAKSPFPGFRARAQRSPPSQRALRKRGRDAAVWRARHTRAESAGPLADRPTIFPPSPSAHPPICARTSRGIGAGNFASSKRRSVEMKVRSTLLCLTHESFMQGSWPACMAAGCWRVFGSEFRLKLQCSDQALT